MNRTLISIAMLLVLSAGCLRHDLLRETPVKDVNLAAREAEEFDDFKAHLLPEGLVVYLRRPPGDVAALYRQGAVQADGAYFQGEALAMLVFKFKATGDPEALALARRVFDAAHLLVKGSGYRGLVARSFGKTDPASSELVFRRDGSGDGLIGWLFGMAVFAKFIDDPERLALLASDLADVCWHLKRHDFKIHESETTPTEYGDFKTPVAGVVPVGHYAVAMMGLANLALALAPSRPEVVEFFELVIERNYPRQVPFFYEWFPHHADNTVNYALSFTVALLFDENARRRAFYLEGAEAFWERAYDWQFALYALLYKRAGGSSKGSMIRDSIDRLRNLPAYRRRLVKESELTRSHLGKIVPLEDRPLSASFWSSNVTEELTSQEGERDPNEYLRLDFLLAFWLGRFLGEYAEGAER